MHLLAFPERNQVKHREYDVEKEGCGVSNVAYLGTLWERTGAKRKIVDTTPTLL